VITEPPSFTILIGTPLAKGPLRASVDRPSAGLSGRVANPGSP